MELHEIESRHVSIPYRYSKNPAYFQPLRQYKGWVSIPYRYSKNQNYVGPGRERVNRFQFLIGILKTKQEGFELLQPDRFQFLIGILKTFLEKSSVKSFPMFQFLIGILKTDAIAELGDRLKSRFNSL